MLDSMDKLFVSRFILKRGQMFPKATARKSSGGREGKGGVEKKNT